jgi:predicted nucleic-acid-binding protein
LEGAEIRSDEIAKTRCMTGLDTNVLARYLLDDDRTQSAQARRAIFDRLDRGESLMICAAAFLELEWALKSRPELKKVDVIAMLRAITEVRELVIDDDDCVIEALHSYENANTDFAECLFHGIYRRRGCDGMLTFDRRAQRALVGCVAP